MVFQIVSRNILTCVSKFEDIFVCRSSERFLLNITSGFDTCSAHPTTRSQHDMFSNFIENYLFFEKREMFLLKLCSLNTVSLVAYDGYFGESLREEPMRVGGGSDGLNHISLAELLSL